MTVPPGTETCGCCAGVEQRTPNMPQNRPGLPEIAYRAGRQPDFRASMITALSGADKPQLSQLRTRDDDDPTIALIDAWATACDVLTFYTERLANEQYLRTAIERTSLQELGKLLAYRLDPGVAAETQLAFTLERPPIVPANLSPDPGVMPHTTPEAALLPAGLRVQSVPGPGERPQTFETVEDLNARASWNALPVVQTTPHLPTRGRIDAWFAGSGLNLQAGEAVLFASDDLVNDRWDVRLITDVESDAPGDRTHAVWEWPLGSINPFNNPALNPDAFVLRKRIPIFGYNAPGYELLHPAPASSTEWPNFVAVSQSGADFIVDLDGAHADVVRGSWVVVSQEDGTFYRELYEVVDRAQLARSEFAVSGPVTRLTLRGEGHSFGTPRQVSVLAVAERLTVVEAPDDSPVSDAVVVVEGDATEMVPGRRLVLAGNRSDGTAAAEVLVLQTAQPAADDRTELTFTSAPTLPFVRAGAVVFGNVAKATHGETVSQVLGDGDARQAFQTMPLSTQQPLTYVQADTPTGSASTLVTTVDGIIWHEVDTTYASTPTAREYVTTTQPDGKTAVEFGDGAHGARLPSGSHNIRARYRIGLGAAGNLQPGQLSQPMDRPLGLKAVTNPVAATGGVNAEPAEHARVSMPLPTRTLGRAVSLRDYADFAVAFAGISRADATVLPLRFGPTVVVTVCAPDGGAAPPSTVSHLETALLAAGDPHVRVSVLPVRPASFRVALKVRIDPDRDVNTALAAVEARLRAVYATSAVQLAQPVHRSQVIATAAAVPGVVGVDLDRLYRGNTPSLDERLPSATAGIDAAGNPLAAELLAISDDPFDWLQVMT